MTWLIVLVAVAVTFVGAALAIARIRSVSLQQRFGPEYGRAVDKKRDRRVAEAVLRDRVRQRDTLELRELTPEAQARYVQQWDAVQTRFVDDARQGVAEAAELVHRVMNEHGYPVDKSDDYGRYVSVDHPDLASTYRAAQAVRTHVGSASIDEQRQAFQNYRSLFDELLCP